MNIYEKLLTVQQKLKAPKNQYNSFGKYNYRSCEDILEGLKSILQEVKAIVMITDHVELIGDRYYIRSVAHFIDIEDGKELNSSAYAREDADKKGMDLAQVTGSVSSYARKYALNGLFCIDDTKDSDHTNTGDDKGKENSAKSNLPLKQESKPKNDSGKPQGKLPNMACSDCGDAIDKAVSEYSIKTYGAEYCRKCQPKYKK